MRTLVLDPAPPGFADLIERRRALGQDLYDEVWGGVYHVAPMARFGHGRLQDELSVVLRPYSRAAGMAGSGPFNLGRPGDFRVPDAGFHRGRPDAGAVYLPTAAVVVEVVSPGDETWEKLGFYAAHGVEELIVVSPPEHGVRIFSLTATGYLETGTSALLGIEAAAIVAAVDWP